MSPLRAADPSDWDITTTNGIPEFTPPKWIDPNRKPRRNPVHKGRNNGDP